MKAEEVEWEVLPPEEKRKRAGVEPLFRWLALVMDQAISLPGTKLRFGLDPIIGLIPGLGDTISTVISAASLIYAARCGVPKILLARMSVNILVNDVIGLIPGVGDAFSFWFKSNQRNYDLLREHLSKPQKPRRSDWLFTFGILALLFLVFAAGLVISYFVIRALLKMA